MCQYTIVEFCRGFNGIQLYLGIPRYQVEFNYVWIYINKDDVKLMNELKTKDDIEDDDNSNI